MGSRQKYTSIVLMTSYCLKAYKGQGVSKITKSEHTYFMDGPYSIANFWYITLWCSIKGGDAYFLEINLCFMLVNQFDDSDI